MLHVVTDGGPHIALVVLAAAAATLAGFLIVAGDGERGGMMAFGMGVLAAATFAVLVIF